MAVATLSAPMEAAARLTGDASSGIPPRHASPHERDEAKAAALFTAHVASALALRHLVCWTCEPSTSPTTRLYISSMIKLDSPASRRPCSAANASTQQACTRGRRGCHSPDQSTKAQHMHIAHTCRASRPLLGPPMNPNQPIVLLRRSSSPDCPLCFSRCADPVDLGGSGARARLPPGAGSRRRQRHLPRRHLFSSADARGSLETRLTPPSRLVALLIVHRLTVTDLGMYDSLGDTVLRKCHFPAMCQKYQLCFSLFGAAELHNTNSTICAAPHAAVCCQGIRRPSWA